MAATASSHQTPKKPTIISFRRRRLIKETTISSYAVSPENTSWCCPPAVASHKPPVETSFPSPQSSSAGNQPVPAMTTAGSAGSNTFSQFNSALTAGLLNPISSPPPVNGPTRCSPTLFEMMASEPDCKIPNQNGAALNANSIPKRPSNGYVDKQALMQQRLSDLLSIRSPGSQFNDPDSSDVKLTLNSKDGLSICLNLHRQILVGHSRFFAVKLLDHRRKLGNNVGSCIVEIADCDDIEVYIESIRLMYCKDLRRRLMKEDVPRVLGILKVSAAIGFDAGVLSCLEYLEAAPWAEDEEEKVASLLSELRLEGVGAGEVLKRVSVDITPGPHEASDNQEILLKLLHVVLEGKDEKARREMKVLVSKMLHESSTQSDLRKESLYSACERSLNLLRHHFLKASKGDSQDSAQIARQSGNLHWLLDILIDRQISEDFLDLWASQTELSGAHSKVPALHRYEVSRVTARLFVGIGKGQLLASKESRCLLLRTWLVPFYDDFAWMRRGSRGLDRHLIEDGLSNTILTLPLAWQQEILMAWFDRFLNSGDDCPNIQRGFEVWWKRAFRRKPEREREFNVINENVENS